MIYAVISPSINSRDGAYLSIYWNLGHEVSRAYGLLEKLRVL
jgi:hypothetical protein